MYGPSASLLHPLPNVHDAQSFPMQKYGLSRKNKSHDGIEVLLWDLSFHAPVEHNPIEISRFC